MLQEGHEDQWARGRGDSEFGTGPGEAEKKGVGVAGTAELPETGAPGWVNLEVSVKVEMNSAL